MFNPTNPISEAADIADAQPVSAIDLRPLAALLTAEDRALIERWCETCRRWTEAGTETAPVMTIDVRSLLQVTVRLARESLAQEAAQTARATLTTLPEFGSNEEGGS